MAQETSSPLFTGLKELGFSASLLLLSPHFSVSHQRMLACLIIFFTENSRPSAFI